MAYTPQQIIDLVNKGDGAPGMYVGSDKAAALAALHVAIAEDMRQLQGAMGEHWQGDAAGQAYAGAGPMVQASQVSGDHLAQAQNLYVGQGSSFNDLHSKVAAVGNLGDKPSDDLVSDTPLSFMSNRADEIAAYNQKAQQVVDSYGLYHGQSTDNSGRWQAPSNYGELNMPPAGVDIQPATPGLGGGPGTENPGSSGYNGAGGGGPVGGGSYGGPQSGGPGGSGGQQQGAPGSGGSVPVHSPVSGNGGTSAAGYVPPPPTSGGLGGFGNQPPGGYSSGGFGPGSGGAGSSDFGPGVGGFGGGGFGPGGGSGGYSSGGFGGRGSGGFSSGSGAGELGAGKGSASGSMSGEPGTARPSGGSASSAAGRPGTSGASGMGRGGGKGEGDEDAEHQRPAYLLEPDPEDALVGELPRFTPPVIGL